MSLFKTYSTISVEEYRKTVRARKYKSPESVSESDSYIIGENLRKVFTVYNSYNSNNLEFEVRYGNFIIRKGFLPSIPISSFRNVEDFLIRNRFTVNKSYRKVESMNYKKGTIRKITDLEDDSVPISWEYKDNLNKVDFDKYGMRIAINREITIKPVKAFKSNNTREIKRNSYVIPERGVIDMSKITQYNKDNIKEERYEIEFEMHKDVVKNSVKKDLFIKMVKKIYLLINKTHMIYKLSEKQGILRDFNALLSGSKKFGNSINRDYVTFPRPIKYRDLVSGGIVNNRKTNYRMSYKVDGIRSFIFVHEDRMWVLSGYSDVNLMYNMPTSELNGTILDVEFVPYENRIMENNAPRNQYWFFVLDCLYINHVNLRMQTHNERLIKAQQFVNIFNNNTFIKINTKDFKSINSSSRLFDDITPKFQSNIPNLSYKTDGYVFVPDKVHYITYMNKNYETKDGKIVNIRNPDQININERSLTRIPEIVKWKPQKQITIDLKFQREQGVIKLYTSKIIGQNEKGRNTFGDVLFEGDDIDPFNINTMLKDRNDILKNALNGNIIEFAWHIRSNDEEDEYLYPERIRNDKVNPNKEDVVLDNWRDIHDPIDIDVLTGNSTKLMRKYHNRVKRQLYKTAYTEKPNSTILDIGSGRGGDIFTLVKNFRKIMLVEPNVSNLAELIHRLYKIGLEDQKQKINIFYKNEKERIQLEILLNDRSKDIMSKVKFRKTFKDITNQKICILQTVGQDYEFISNARKSFLGKGKFDVISMMFSLSFFWESKEILGNLSKSIYQNSTDNAMFIFITINGDAVEHLYNPKNGKAFDYFKSVNGVIKMRYIKAKPPQKAKVEIYIKDSIVGTDEESQTEWLVKMEDLKSLLSGKHKFTERFYRRLQNEDMLTEIEKKYTQLIYSGIYDRNIDSFLSISGKKSDLTEIKLIENIEQIESINDNLNKIYPLKLNLLME